MYFFHAEKKKTESICTCIFDEPLHFLAHTHIHFTSFTNSNFVQCKKIRKSAQWRQFEWKRRNYTRRNIKNLQFKLVDITSCKSIFLEAVAHIVQLQTTRLMQWLIWRSLNRKYRQQWWWRRWWWTRKRRRQCMAYIVI